MTVACCRAMRRPLNCWPRLGSRMERKTKRLVEEGFFRRALRQFQATRLQEVQNTASVPSHAAFDNDLELRLRGNERIWTGFRDIELRMLAAETLQAVLAVLSRDLPARFPGVHAVSIAWLDPDYEVTRLLEQESDAPENRIFFALHSP